jgi:hypothetical protein
VIFRCLALNPIPQRRAEFWSKADASSPDRWKHSTRPQRDYIWQEVIGRVGAAYLPQNVRTRLIYDEPSAPPPKNAKAVRHTKARRKG